MPAINNSREFARTFTIGRETDDKKSPPHFFEYFKDQPAETPKGAKYRKKTSNLGKVSHYHLWQGWSGHLVGLETPMKTYGSGKPEKMFVATLDDSEEIVKIELPFFGSYASDLMKRLLDDNFDPSQSLSLSPYAMDKKSGTGQNVGINCTSGADTALSARARDFGEGANLRPASPHLADMPGLEEFIVKEEKVLDNTKQTNWLWAQLEQKVLPKLSALGGSAQARQTVPHTQEHSAYRDSSRREPDNMGFPATETVDYENSTPDRDMPF